MNTTTNGATLIAHCGARKITREELRELPIPEGTRTHQPLSHLAIVETLIEALSFRYLRVVRDEYAVSPDGMRMFGVMDLSAEIQGCRFSIGLRNSNDKSMRLALTAGLRVTVCDNMMFSGDFAPLLHKHTRRLELLDAISVAVDRIQRGFAPLERQISDWQDTHLADEQVKLIIYEAFLDNRLKVPKHLMTLVHDHYFKPEKEAFRERTFWSLSNAFTSAFKKLLPVQQFSATAKLGRFLTEVYDRLPEDTLEQLDGLKRVSDEGHEFRSVCPVLIGNAPVTNGDSEQDKTRSDEPDDDELLEVPEELERDLTDGRDDFPTDFDERGFQAGFGDESASEKDEESIEAAESARGLPSDPPFTEIAETTEENPAAGEVTESATALPVTTRKPARQKPSQRKTGKSCLKLAA
jgi:hypothetical protein